MILSFQLLGRYTFRQKILMGFAVLLAVIGVIVVVAVIAAHQVKVNTNLFIQSANDVKSTTTLQQSMSSLQRVVPLYLSSPDQTTLQEVRDHQKQLNFHAQTVTGIPQIFEGAEVTETFQYLIVKYNTDLENLIALVLQIDNLTYFRLREISDKIGFLLDQLTITNAVHPTRETLIATISVNRIKHSLNAARLGVQIYLNTGNESRLSDVHKYLDKAMDQSRTLVAMNEQTVTRDSSEKVFELLPVYREVVDKIIAKNVVRARIKNQSLDMIAGQILENPAAYQNSRRPGIILYGWRRYQPRNVLSLPSWQLALLDCCSVFVLLC